MKVLVDARIKPGESGGVEQAIIGLIRCLGVPENTDIDPYFLVLPAGKDWIQQFVGDSERVIIADPPERSWRFPQRLMSLRKIKVINFFIATLRGFGVFGFSLAVEPRQVRELSPDLIHFPLQIGFRTEYPNVYQPHDLQHIAFPQFFSKEELLARSIIYSEMIMQAGSITVGNEWTKRDVMKAYPNQKSLVANVPVMPQLPPVKVTRTEFEKDSITLLYPASYWPHKNHANLFAAIGILKNQGQRVFLICTGARISNNRYLQKLIEKFQIQGEVSLRGFLPRAELDELYGLSDVIVMPSYFESESLPIWEAFFHGTPVVASRITAIPDQVRGAAVLFDPDDPDEIANSIMKVHSDVALRTKMLKEADSILSKLTSLNTFIGYRYHYRRLLNHELDSIDQKWLKEGFRF